MLDLEEIRHPYSMRNGRWLAVVAALTLLAWVAGCGGGGGGSVVEPASPKPALLKGRFIDSPVANLEYSVASQSGVTDGDGYFLYENQGQHVTFYLAGVAVGTAPVSEVVHVFDLSGSAGPFGEVSGLRLAQLLQTLDADLNTANGIQLSDAGRAALSAQGALDLSATDGAWSTYLGTLASRLGRSPVSLDAARAHAVASVPADAACPVIAAEYPLQDTYKLGLFSTAGRSCKQKALATAFYQDIVMDMASREGTARQSDAIANGETLAQKDVEALISQNIAANAMDWLLSIADFEQVNGLATNKDRILRLLSVSTGVAQKAADLLTAIGCVGELPCKDTAKSSMKAASVVLGVMSRSTACMSNDVAKCAEAVKSAVETWSYFKGDFGTVPAEKVSQFTNLFVAWAVPAIDSVAAAVGGDPAKAYQAGGSYVDAALKTLTGFYFRTSDQTARRKASDNAIEILGEAIKVAADCTIRTSLDTAKTCVGTVTAYTNRRAAEIFAYLGLAALADDSNFDADSVAVASMTMSEVLRHGGIYAAMGHYGVTWPSADGVSVNAALASLAKQVAIRARFEPISTAMLLLSDYAKAVEYYHLYWAALQSSANSLLAGRTATCSSVRLGALAVELPAGHAVLQPGQSATFQVAVLSTAPLQGFLVDAGDGTVATMPDSTSTHAYSGAGRYKVRATPIVRAPNGGLVTCEAKAATAYVNVAAPLTTVWSDDFSAAALDTSRWVVDSCQPDYNAFPAKLSVVAGELRADVPGGSDGYMGKCSGTKLLSRAGPIAGDFESTVKVRELLRQAASGYKDNSGLIFFYGGAQIGIGGNHSGYWYGVPYNTYQKHRILGVGEGGATPCVLDESLDLTRLYELELRIRRENGIGFLGYRLDGSAPWTERSCLLPATGEFSLLAWSGDGGETRLTGRVLLAIDDFIVKVPTVPGQASLLGAAWSITGTDLRGTSWAGSTLTIERQTPLASGFELAGYFNWVSSSGSRGRENFVGTLGADGVLLIRGTAIVPPASGLVLGEYRALFGLDAKHIVGGTWTSATGVGSDFWSASRP